MYNVILSLPLLLIRTRIICLFKKQTEKTYKLQKPQKTEIMWNFKFLSFFKSRKDN